MIAIVFFRQKEYMPLCRSEFPEWGTELRFND